MMGEMVAWFRKALDAERDEIRENVDHYRSCPDCAGRETTEEARQLAEIKVKRRILDEIVPQLEGFEWDSVAGRDTTEQLVRLMVSAYAHLPGYRPEWRPEQ